MTYFVDMRFEGMTPDKLKRLYDERLVENAIHAAMGKAVAKARTTVSKTVRLHWNIKARSIARRVKVKRLQTKVAERFLLYRGGYMGINHFGGKKKVVSRKGRKYQGATVQVKKTRPRKLLGASSSRNAGFWATVNKRDDEGNEMIFRRAHPERTTRSGKIAIERVFGPSIPQMVDDPEVLDATAQKFQYDMAEEFDRAMQRKLSQAGYR